VSVGACAACGSDSTFAAQPYVARLRDEDAPFRGLTLYGCSSCGSHAAHPLPAPDVLAAYYRSRYRADGRNAAPCAGFPADQLWYLSRGLAVARLIGPVLNAVPGRRGRRSVIDVGAGYGHTAFALRRVLRDAVDITALEPDPGCHPTLAPVADRVIGIDALDPRAAELVPGRVDAVLLLHVLEHVRDPIAFLRQLRGWLQRGGALLLEVPHVPPARIGVFDDANPHVPHLHFFTPAGVRAALERSGFAVSWVRSYGPELDERGAYDASFARRPVSVAEALATPADVPPLPFPCFLDAGTNRLFLRALAFSEIP
jgi:SAM-dependent methyltransferase